MAAENLAPTRSREANHGGIVLAAGIALGVLGDALLRALPWGLGFALWALALVSAGAALTVRRDGRLRTETGVWLALAAVLAWMFALRTDDQLRVLTFAGIVGALIGARTTAARSPVLSIVGARIADVLRSAGAAIRDVAIGFPQLILADVDAVGRKRTARQRQLLTAVRLVVIAVPILAIFSALLVSADPVFGSWFRLPDAETIAQHAFVTLIVTWIVAGGLRGAILGGGTVELRTIPPIRLGSLEVAAVLGGLALLFLAFVGTQIGWLFGGEAFVRRTTGLTYATYARRGFFELVAVSGLLLPVLLIGRATLVEDRSIRLFRRLSILVLLLLFAILVSAVARLQLYVRYYGLSEDRLYAIAALTCITLIWLWFGATILQERPRLFALGAIVAAYAVLGMLHVLGPANVVTRFNVAYPRLGATERSPIDYQYLATLGAGSVPPLVEALLRPPVSAASSPQRAAETASRCRAALSLWHMWVPRPGLPVRGDWRSWNLAVARARATMRDRERELYRIPCALNGQPVPAGAPVRLPAP